MGSPGCGSRLCEILSDTWSHVSAQAFLRLDSVPRPISYLHGALWVYHSGLVLFGAGWEKEVTRGSDASSGRPGGMEVEMPGACRGTGPIPVAMQVGARLAGSARQLSP